jgi:hypothetical protein
MLRAYSHWYVRYMPMYAWGLDEALEAIGLIYVLLVGLFILLVALEQGLPEIPTRHTRLVRELSRQWLNDAHTEPEPVIVWLGRSSSWDSARLGRKLHLTSDETVRLLRLAGYEEARPGQWRSERRRPLPR